MEAAAVFKMQARRLLHRTEPRCALTASLLVAAVAFAETCARFYGADAGSLPSAAYGWAWNMDAMQVNAMRVLAFFLIFLIAASVHADSFVVDFKSGAAACVATRSSLASYLASNAVLSFVGGFVVIFAPLALTQLLAFLVFPAQGSFDGRFNMPAYEVLPSVGALFPGLAANHPYLDNLVYLLYAPLWAGAMSALSFAISLYAKKSRLVVIGLPTAAVLLAWQAFSFLFRGSASMTHFYYLYPNSMTPNLSEAYFFAAPLVVLGAGAALVAFAVRSKKDVLL